MSNIKIASFNYTKSNGDKSDRKLLVIASPSDSFFGIEVDNDLTDLTPYLKYLQELEDCKNNLKAKYKLDTLNLPYKRFKETGMCSLTEQTINVDEFLD